MDSREYLKDPNFTKNNASLLEKLKGKPCCGSYVEEDGSITNFACGMIGRDIIYSIEILKEQVLNDLKS